MRKKEKNRVERELFKNRKAALAAGIALLAMALAAGLAYGYLHNQLVVPDSAAATRENILVHGALFAAEAALWWVIFLLDILVSLALYSFYRNLSKPLALTVMSFRLLYSLILAAGILFFTTARTAGEEALARIVLFEKIWSLGLIPFGIHLFLLGLLAGIKRSTPPFLTWLLLFAGLCYALLNLLYNLGGVPADLAARAEPVLAAPMALAELLPALWLIAGAIRSGKGNP